MDKKQYDDICEILSKDTNIGKIINAIPLEFTKNDKDVCEALIKSVISQQLSTKVAAIIYQRFLDSKGECELKAYINQAKIEDLCTIGLSKQKAIYIKNIVSFFDQNNLDDYPWDQKSDEEIIELLTKIHGVGIWTVQMLLMFTLYREDVFPKGDLAIKTQMKTLYGLEGNKKEIELEMEKIAMNWRPYRTWACLWLWASKDN